MLRPSMRGAGHRRRTGFSLIEISVAMVVTSIIASLTVALVWHRAVDDGLRGLGQLESLQRVHRLLEIDADKSVGARVDGPTAILTRVDGSLVRYRVDHAAWIREVRAAEAEGWERIEMPVLGVERGRWRLQPLDRGRLLAVELHMGGLADPAFSAPIDWVFYLPDRAPESDSPRGRDGGAPAEAGGPPIKEAER